MFSGVIDVIDGATESTSISTQTDSLRLPAVSWTQISKALAPCGRLRATDQSPLPTSTLRILSIHTLVSASRFPVRVMTAVLERLSKGRTRITPVATVPPVMAGAAGGCWSTVKAKL